MIGQQVRAVIDYGKPLPDDRQMIISRCTLIGDTGAEIDIIVNGTVVSLLSNYVQLVDTGSSRLAEFMWHVFQSGKGSRATISCQMKLVKPALLLLSTYASRRGFN